MRTILFPTDFSELADNAFVYAIELAKSIGANIHVLHSYEAPLMTDSFTGQPEHFTTLYEEIEHTQREEFDKRIPQVKAFAANLGLDSIRLKFSFLEGAVPFAVNNIVEEEKIHVIVMGTHGQSGFLDRIIGSNTANVIQSTPLPVLAIPPHARYKGIDKVLFTTLFRDQDKKALREALIMAAEVNAKTECAYVINSNDITLIKEKIKDWKIEFEKYDVQFKLLENIESVENTITHYILENDIDIIALVKRNRGFFERMFNASTTNKLTFHTKIPIMVYHEEKTK